VDEATISLIAKQIVNTELLLNWKFYAVFLAISLLACVGSSFLVAYFTSRGKHFATKADFDELLKQLRLTTEVTESIKQSLSHHDWSLREFKTIKRTKLEELFNAIFETHYWLDECRKESLFDGDKVKLPDPLNKVYVIGNLYFPELGAELRAFQEASIKYKLFTSETLSGLLPLKKANNAPAITSFFEENTKKFGAVYKNILDTTTMLEMRAKDIMNSLLNVGS
jgi:hypothetical protein